MSLILTRFVLALLLLGAPSMVLAESPLTVEMATDDYPPLIGKRLPYQGILTRIVVEAFAKSGVTVTLTWVPTNRSIMGVMDGLYDGSFGWAHAPDRDARLLYSRNAIYNFRMVFFQRRGENYPWKKLEDLAPYRLGATMGNHYSDEFSVLQAARKLKVDSAPADAQNMLKLAAKRIDLFPMEQEAGEMLADLTLAPEERSKIVRQNNAIWEIPTFLVIRRSHPKAQELVARFDRGYQELARSGRLKALIEEVKRAIRDQSRTPSNLP